MSIKYNELCKDFVLLCELAKIGHLIGEPLRVMGGKQHQLWKITTDQGMFAAKCLNRRIVKEKTNYCAHLAELEVAVRDLAMHGLAVLPSLCRENRVVWTVQGEYWMVFPWLEGKVFSDAAVSVNHAKYIGHLLAGIHLQSKKMRLSNASAIQAVHWQALLEQGKTYSQPWVKPMLAQWDSLQDWSSRLYCDQHDIVFSHRDLTQSNSIWVSDEQAVVIDWEWAGPIDCAVELIGVALNWSGIYQQQLDEAAFAAILSGYFSVLDKKVFYPEVALVGIVRSWLGWLETVMLRGMASSDREQQQAHREASACLAAFQTICEKEKKILSLCSAYL